MYSSIQDPVIIGSRGALGTWFGDVLSKRGIRHVGVDLLGGDNIVAGDIERPDVLVDRLIAEATVVILAVPEHVAIRAAPTVGKKIKGRGLLVDCCSVKHGYVAAVSGIEHIEMLSLNPLFGPSLENSNRPVVTTTIRGGALTDIILKILKDEVGDLVEMDARKHDAYMSNAQAGVHALILAFLMCSVGKIEPSLSTPPASVFTRLAARMVSLSSHIYWEIQTCNPFANETRQALITALQNLDTIATRGDLVAFEQIFNLGNNALGSQVPRYADECVRLFELLNLGGDQK